MSHDAALIELLTTTLGLKDMYDLLEVLLVDQHNERRIRKMQRNREN